MHNEGKFKSDEKLAPNQDELMKMQKFSAASPKCDTLVWIKEYLVWAAPPNPHIAAIYIANI